MCCYSGFYVEQHFFFHSSFYHCAIVDLGATCSWPAGAGRAQRGCWLLMVLVFVTVQVFVLLMFGGRTEASIAKAEASE